MPYKQKQSQCTLYPGWKICDFYFWCETGKNALTGQNTQLVTHLKGLTSYEYLDECIYIFLYINIVIVFYGTSNFGQKLFTYFHLKHVNIFFSISLLAFCANYCFKFCLREFTI